MPPQASVNFQTLKTSLQFHCVDKLVFSTNRINKTCMILKEREITSYGRTEDVKEKVELELDHHEF